MLGDGVDGGSAGNGPHVVGGTALGGQLDLVQPLDDPRQLFDGVCGSELIKGMSSLGLHLDAITHGAHGLCHDTSKAAVKGAEALDPAAVDPADLPDAPQVSKALLAGVAHQKEPFLPERLQGFPLPKFPGKVFCRKQKAYQTGGVVSHAGTAEPAVFLLQGQGLQVRKHHVHMGHKYLQRPLALCFHRIDHITRSVNEHALCSLLQQPVPAELPSGLLPAGGGGDPGQGLQQLQGLLLVFRNKLFHLSIQHVFPPKARSILFRRSRGTCPPAGSCAHESPWP